MKLFFKLLLFFPLFLSAQIDFDIEIDSLTLLKNEKGITSQERIDFVRQIKKLQKKKFESLKDSLTVFRDTESINISIRIEKLWEESQKKTSFKEKVEIYEMISLYKEGQILLMENIDKYIPDYDEGTFEEMANYPVFIYLSERPTLGYFEYLNKELCNIKRDENFDFLLLALSGVQIDRMAYEILIKSLLQKPCISDNQISSIKSHLNMR